MSVELVLNATPRKEQGRGASRRLRRAKQIPAIMYGTGKETVPLALDEEQVLRLMRTEQFFSQIIDVKVKGKKTEQAILKDLQRHPFKPLVAHLDLLRIKSDEMMRQTVPIHYLNEETARGVKTGGGVIHHDAIELEVECLPKDLPEYLELDVAELDVDQAYHFSDVTVPEDVTLMGLDEEHDPPVVSISLPRGGRTVEEDEADAEEGAGEADSDENQE